jgi:hypothetical protein
MGWSHPFLTKKENIVVVDGENVVNIHTPNTVNNLGSKKEQHDMNMFLSITSSTFT